MKRTPPSTGTYRQYPDPSRISARGSFDQKRSADVALPSFARRSPADSPSPATSSPRPIRVAYRNRPSPTGSIEVNRRSQRAWSSGSCVFSQSSSSGARPELPAVLAVDAHARRAVLDHEEADAASALGREGHTLLETSLLHRARHLLQLALPEVGEERDPAEQVGRGSHGAIL